jgi:hypothetical protein
MLIFAICPVSASKPDSRDRHLLALSVSGWLGCLCLPVFFWILDYFGRSRQAAVASFAVSRIVTFPRVYVIIPAVCKMLADRITLDLRIPSICPKNSCVVGS